MLHNFFVLFFRNLQRQKLFSIINLLGLTVSIASALFIFLFVLHELSFDNFHPNQDRLYRVNQTMIWGEDNNAQFSRTGPGVAHAMKEELEEVELVTSLHTPGNFIMTYEAPGNKIISFEEDKVLTADTNFFKVFNFPLVKGSIASSFSRQNTLMLTESAAVRYFGEADPLGKMILVAQLQGEELQPFEVIGVLKDIPDNSTLEFEVLLSGKNFPMEKLHWSWIWTQLETFVLFKENTDINNVQEKLVSIPRKRAEETLQKIMNVSYDEYIQSGKKWELFLQPIHKLHLPDEKVNSSFQNVGNPKVILSLVGSALFIVLLSCINFMNLSTAQFTRRIKEASIRKVLGLNRKELGISYVIEALIFCTISMIIALALNQALLPFFNAMTGKNLELNLFSNGSLLMGILALVGIMTFLSSSYPAFFLSSFKPAEALKGKMKSGKEGKWFRSGLVVFQFSVSIILMICTAIVFQQLNFVSEKDLGFDKENVIQLDHLEAVKNKEAVVHALMNVPGVLSASQCNSTPPRIYGGDSFTAEGQNGKPFPLIYASADENYLSSLGLKLKYGRNFNPATSADVNHVIINEATLRKLGWPDDESVLGRALIYSNEDNARFEVIGVVPDFNYWSLEMNIDPMAIFHIDNPKVHHGDKRYIAIRLQSGNEAQWKTVIAGIQNSWKTTAGDTPFEYGFLDDYFAETFRTQQQMGNVLVVMATLSILIACLGLLGTIIYSLEQRTKEIGIRKVSGATITDILIMVGKRYAFLVIIAFVVGAPVSYLIMDEWLKDFSFRITPSLWIFLGTGIATLSLVALITGYHSWKSAQVNPVTLLKDE